MGEGKSWMGRGQKSLQLCPLATQAMEPFLKATLGKRTRQGGSHETGWITRDRVDHTRQGGSHVRFPWVRRHNLSLKSTELNGLAGTGPVNQTISVRCMILVNSDVVELVDIPTWPDIISQNLSIRPLCPAAIAIVEISHNSPNLYNLHGVIPLPYPHCWR